MRRPGCKAVTRRRRNLQVFRFGRTLRRRNGDSKLARENVGRGLALPIVVFEILGND
jgi:hypothetical protein